MSLQRRSIFAMAIVLVILVTMFVFSQLLYVTDLWGYREPTSGQLTATSIVAQNYLIETLISQTQTATAQAPVGTFTPLRP
jgi:hypothetical protein